MSAFGGDIACAALKKAVFVLLLKRDIVLSVHNTMCSKSARLASIDRNYLYRMMKKHGIARKE